MLIINPVAGRRLAERGVTDILRIFSDNDYLTTTLVTGKRGDATNFVIDHGGDFELIVCMGGDGTLNETISGLARANLTVPLGYIPCGSTNDFAVSHKLSANIRTAAKHAATGDIKLLDIGSFNTRHFVSVAAFGAFSWLSYSTPQNLKNTFGHSAYIIDSIKSLPKLKPEHMRLRSDAGYYENDYIFGAICNTRIVGGALPLPKKEVHTDDGLFEVLLIRQPKTLQEWQCVIHALLTEDYKCEHIDFFKTDHLTIENDTAAPWSLDGEESAGSPVIEVQNLKQFLRLRV